MEQLAIMKLKFDDCQENCGFGSIILATYKDTFEMIL